MERVLENTKKVYGAFMDLGKAYDKVNKKAPWDILCQEPSPP